MYNHQFQRVLHLGTPVFMFIFVTLFTGFSILFNPAVAHAQGPGDIQEIDPAPLQEIPTGGLQGTIEPSELRGIETPGAFNQIISGALGGVNYALDNCEPSRQNILGGALSGALSVGIEKLSQSIGSTSSGGSLLSTIGKFAPLVSAVPGLGSVGSILGGVLGGLGGGSGGGAGTVTEPSLRQKERCLDALARASAQSVLQDMIDQTLSWVQEGFEGENPGFVTNLEKRLRDVAEVEHISYLYDYQKVVWEGMCDVYRRPVYQSLRTDFLEDYPEASGVTERTPSPEEIFDSREFNEVCELQRVLDEKGAEVEEFLAGDFSKGGWEAFGALITDTDSNPYFAYISRAERMRNELLEAQQNEREELIQNQGFLSDKRCVDASGNLSTVVPEEDTQSTTATGRGNLCPSGQYPITVTPGKTVGELLGSAVTSDMRRAELVDELDETIADFGDLLVAKIVGRGDGSRLGLTGRDDGYFADGVVIDKENLAANLVKVEKEQFSPVRQAVYAGRTPVDWEGEPFQWNPVWIDELGYQKISWTGRNFQWEGVSDSENETARRLFPAGEPSVCLPSTEGAVSYVLRTDIRIGPYDEQSLGILNPRDGVYPPGVWEKTKCDPEDGWVADEWSDKHGPPPEDCQYAIGAGDRWWCGFDAWRLPETQMEGKTYRKDASGVFESGCKLPEDEGTHYFVLNEHDTWRTRECVVSDSPEGQLVQWADQQELKDRVDTVRYDALEGVGEGDRSNLERETVDQTEQWKRQTIARQNLIIPFINSQYIIDYSNDTGQPVFLECVRGLLPDEECNVFVGQPNKGSPNEVEDFCPVWFELEWCHEANGSEQCGFSTQSQCSVDATGSSIVGENNPCFQKLVQQCEADGGGSDSDNDPEVIGECIDNTKVDWNGNEFLSWQEGWYYTTNGEPVGSSSALSLCDNEYIGITHYIVRDFMWRREFCPDTESGRTIQSTELNQACEVREEDAGGTEPVITFAGDRLVQTTGDFTIAVLASDEEDGDLSDSVQVTVESHVGQKVDWNGNPFEWEAIGTRGNAYTEDGTINETVCDANAEGLTVYLGPSARDFTWDRSECMGSANWQTTDSNLHDPFDTPPTTTVLSEEEIRSGYTLGPGLHRVTYVVFDSDGNRTRRVQNIHVEGTSGGTSRNQLE